MLTEFKIFKLNYFMKKKLNFCIYIKYTQYILEKMVILNIDFSVNRQFMINSIKKLIEKAIENYIENEALTKNKKKIAEDIVKENMYIVKSNNFWYLNSSENVCTFIHKRGKKEGYMCHKKIKTNLIDKKADYLCCTHSKKHVPKKRKKET